MQPSSLLTPPFFLNQFVSDAANRRQAGNSSRPLDLLSEQEVIPLRAQVHEAFKYIKPLDKSSPIAKAINEMKILTAPAEPRFQLIQQRIGTFDDEFSETFNAAPVQEWAEAGFRYTGSGNNDRMMCWYCNGGIVGIEEGDNPFAEHARHYPSCAFINSVIGPAQVMATRTASFQVNNHGNITLQNAVSPAHLKERVELYNSNNPDTRRKMANDIRTFVADIFQASEEQINIVERLATSRKEDCSQWEINRAMEEYQAVFPSKE